MISTGPSMLNECFYSSELALTKRGSDYPKCYPSSGICATSTMPSLYTHRMLCIKTRGIFIVTSVQGASLTSDNSLNMHENTNSA